MAKLFGTDGMRGEAGRFPLDALTVYTTGRSLVRHLAARLGRAPRLVTGRDTRESGPWIEQALLAGARQEGAQCESAGVITTPGIAYLTSALPADAGVVISASHNPYRDNGIKIFAPTGQKIDDATERCIEADIESAKDALTASAPLLTEDGSVEMEETAALRARYLDHLADEAAAGLELAGVKVVVDCANGAASGLAPELFARLGAHVIAINHEPDGRNINLNCGSLHLDALKRQVMERGADLGVAFDGDADRVLFIDAQGRVVDGDATLWVMAKHLAARGELNADTVVATVMSNIGLELALRSRGWKLLRTDVGDKYVLEALLRTGATLGGEQSGHIIFTRHSLAGDGMLTAICVLRAMRAAGVPLADLVEGFTRYPQTLVNVRVDEKRPFAEVPEIVRAARETEAALGEQGRLLLRYSGTEPLARVMIEGTDQDEIERLANRLAATIQASLGAGLSGEGENSTR
jgi:phosphoglucosamine mutase